MFSRLAVAGAVVILCAARPAAGQTAPALETVLHRAGLYVAQFIDRFSNVVAEERYVQDTLGNQTMITAGRGTVLNVPPPARHRELRSDFLLVQLKPGDWLPFRDVFEVDGTAIRDREGRLAKLFLDSSTSSAIDQATKISNESARYNLGAIQRTINMPILPLVFLQLDTQSHFRFVLGRREAAAGESVWIVEYKEETQPTLIKGIRGSNIPSTGRYLDRCGHGTRGKDRARFGNSWYPRPPDHFLSPR